MTEKILIDKCEYCTKEVFFDKSKWMTDKQDWEWAEHLAYCFYENEDGGKRRMASYVPVYHKGCENFKTVGEMSPDELRGTLSRINTQIVEKTK